jgi:hypothetical protein
MLAIGFIHTVRSDLFCYRNFIFYKMSMLIFVEHFYRRDDNVLRHMSSIMLLRMKIYYSFELDVLNCFSMY